MPSLLRTLLSSKNWAESYTRILGIALGLQTWRNPSFLQITAMVLYLLAAGILDEWAARRHIRYPLYMFLFVLGKLPSISFVRPSAVVLLQILGGVLSVIGLVVQWFRYR